MERNELTVILEKIIHNLEENEVDLAATPAIFKWNHPVTGAYEFQLLIRKRGENEEDDEEYGGSGQRSVH